MLLLTVLLVTILQMFYSSAKWIKRENSSICFIFLLNTKWIFTIKQSIVYSSESYLLSSPHYDIMKIFKHTDKLKELCIEQLHTRHLDSTNIWLYKRALSDLYLSTHPADFKGTFKEHCRHCYISLPNNSACILLRKVCLWILPYFCN